MRLLILTLLSLRMQQTVPYKLAWDIPPAGSLPVSGYTVKWTDSCATQDANGTCQIPSYPSTGGQDVGNVTTATVSLPRGKWYVYVITYTMDPSTNPPTRKESGPSNIIVVSDSVPLPPINLRLVVP